MNHRVHTSVIRRITR